MLRLSGLVLAVSFAAQATPPASPPRVARYVLAESRKTVSAGGEKASAVRGPVTVLGGTARWDLEGGSFPRSKANSLVMGDRGGWVVDRTAAVAARAGAGDVRSLFVPPGEGEAGPFQATVRDVEVSPAEVSAGPAFEGRATSRCRVLATWVLVTSMPGRVSRIRSRLTAVLDVVADPPLEALSPLDELDRLFDVPGPVGEALAPELESLRGWPVAVVVETESEQSVDYPGAAPPPPDGAKPARTRVEATRVVSALVTRPAVEGDAAAVALPEKARVIGLERLVESPETLR